MVEVHYVHGAFPPDTQTYITYLETETQLATPEATSEPILLHMEYMASAVNNQNFPH